MTILSTALAHFPMLVAATKFWPPNRRTSSRLEPALRIAALSQSAALITTPYYSLSDTLQGPAQRAAYALRLDCGSIPCFVCAGAIKLSPARAPPDAEDMFPHEVLHLAPESMLSLPGCAARPASLTLSKPGVSGATVPASHVPSRLLVLENAPDHARQSGTHHQWNQTKCIKLSKSSAGRRSL
jgi:hypothetical protein